MAIGGDQAQQLCHSPITLISATLGSRRVEIDIGCGDGKFLARVASRQPETHFIGIEVASRLAHRAAEQVGRQGSRNVTVINGDAEAYIDNLVDESVDALHIYFPTPFPESIGLSRRLVTMRFAGTAHRVLRTGGITRLLTDHKEYYYQMIRALHLSRVSWQFIAWRPVAAGQPSGQLVGTPWEQRALVDQQRIWNLCVIK
ncbi:MAG TPA: methyltransferase domain-containing protein [Kofleriaceae bacterium]